MNPYLYVGGNPLRNVDPSGLTWASNSNYFWEWVFGRGANNRAYGPNDVETQEIEKSVAAQKMREA